MNSRLKQIGSFWKYVLQRFMRNDASYRAAALTYASLLAVVPLFVVILKIISILPIYEKLTAKVQAFLFANFVVTKSGIIHHHLNEFARQAGHLSFVGSIFLVFMAITVLFTIERIFNRIWETKLPNHKLKTMLSYWLGLLVAPTIVVVAMIITSIVMSLSFFEMEIPFISVTLLAMLPFVLTVLGFSSLYFFVPNCKIHWQHAMLSGLFSTVLFIIVKNMLAWYLASFSIYKLIYGSFAVIPIILLWVYSIWMITLLGAEVCYALGYRNVTT